MGRRRATGCNIDNFFRRGNRHRALKRGDGSTLPSGVSIVRLIKELCCRLIKGIIAAMISPSSVVLYAFRKTIVRSSNDSNTRFGGNILGLEYASKGIARLRIRNRDWSVDQAVYTKDAADLKP